MSRKTIAIVNNDSDLRAKIRNIESIHEEFDERKKFLVKQAEKLAADHDEKIQSVWVEIRNVIRDKNLADWYDEKKWHLHYEQDMDVLYACDDSHSENSFFEFLKGLTQ